MSIPREVAASYHRYLTALTYGVSDADWEYADLCEIEFNVLCDFNELDPEAVAETIAGTRY